jgi:hypothetical protein
MAKQHMLLHGQKGKSSVRKRQTETQKERQTGSITKAIMLLAFGGKKVEKEIKAILRNED